MYRPRNRHCRLALQGAVVLGVVLAIRCGSPEQVVLGRGAAEAGADGGRVLAFVLVDVATRLDLRQIADGDTIDTTGAPVSIRAVVAPPDPGSVVFAVDGQSVRTGKTRPG
jgi:hypothetical protein